MIDSLWPRLDILPHRSGDYGMSLPRYRRTSSYTGYGDRPLDPTKLTLAIPFLSDATIIQREPNILSCIVNRIGVPGRRGCESRSVSRDDGMGNRETVKRTDCE